MSNKQFVERTEYESVQKLYKSAVDCQQKAQRESRDNLKKLFLFQNQIKVIISELENKEKDLQNKYYLAKNTKRIDESVKIEAEKKSTREAINLIRSRISVLN